MGCPDGTRVVPASSPTVLFSCLGAPIASFQAAEGINGRVEQLFAMHPFVLPSLTAISVPCCLTMSR